jgi:hypothetical protein
LLNEACDTAAERFHSTITQVSLCCFLPCVLPCPLWLNPSIAARN